MAKKHLVILTGAGISAESGLKTFRDSDGLWNGYNVYDVATPGAWKKDPAMVLDFYNMRRREVAAAKPNKAHVLLAELEQHFDITIITQNIDDLHERAGSSKVLHLHGEIFKMRSEKNEYLIYEIKDDIQLGDKAEDGYQLRPAIVWFEEPVPMIERAAAVCSDCDVFAVIGTSLQVYPAAGLLNYLPPYLPKYVIDKKLPSLPAMHNLVAIEKIATEGVEEFVQKIMEQL